MAGGTAADLRQVMDRVFFNALLIVQGVVLGYGAEVLVDLLSVGAPWSSLHNATIYLAWLVSILFATLALVSQSFGSHRTPLHPTTPVILLTIGLAIAEFVGLGVLKSQRAPATLTPWLLAVVAQTFLAFLFVSMVLRYSNSHRHRDTILEPDMAALVRQDRIAAGALCVSTGLCWAVIEVANVPDGNLWPVPLVIAAVVLKALVEQQKKLRVRLETDED